MENLLLATDGSAASEGAVDTASEYLAMLPEARLMVLYVTELDLYAYDLAPEAVDRAEKQRAQDIERAIGQRLQPWAERVRFLHRQGHAAATICQVAGEYGADLIIVGSHGRGLVDRLLLGSVAHGVLNRASVPVLVVPHAPMRDRKA